MANFFDDITAQRSSVLDRLSAGEPVDPAEREQLNQIATGRTGEFRKGLRRAGYNASATVDAFVGGIAEPIAPDFAAQKFEQANNMQQQMPDTLRPQVESFRDVDSVGSAGAYAAGTLGEAATSIGGMVAAGLAARYGLGGALRLGATGKNVAQYGGSMAAMLPQEGGETALSLRNNPEAMANTTAGERAALALGRGTVNSALESFVPNVLLTNTIAGTAGRIAAGARPALGNIARKAGAGVVGEGATEGAQELTGQFAENLAVPGTGYDAEPVLESAIRGAIAGGVLGGAGGSIQAARSNIDAAAERAVEEGAPAAQDALNRAVAGVDNLVRNPEQAGVDITNATMGSLAEAAERAREVGGEVAERAGPAAASGIDAIVAMRQRMDEAVMGKLTPDNAKKYRELTKNLRLLNPSEYELLRDAMETGNAEQINEAVGSAAALFGKRVPRETLDGIKGIASWAKKFGAGVTKAAREGRKASASYAKEDVTRFKAFLADQYPQVLRTMESTDVSDGLSRMLMTYRDNAQLLNAKLRPKDQEAMEFFEAQTGVPLTDVLDNARNWRNDNLTRREKQDAFAESTGSSPTLRITGELETLLTDDLRDQYEADGIEIGPGATENESGAIRDDTGQLINEEDTRRTPYNSLGQIKRILGADLIGGSVITKAKNPGFTLPATLRSKDKGVTAEFIGRMLGGKDSIVSPDGKWSGREVPVDADTIAMRTTEDGGYRQEFNSIDMAAQAGTPQERGGSKENFEGFVPEFDGTNRDLNIQGYRLLAAISSMHSNGIDIPRSDIDPALLEEYGLDPDGEDIHIDVAMPPGSLSTKTVVQRGNKNTTIGDLLGTTRAAKSLRSQLDLLDTLGPNPNGELMALKEGTGDKTPLTAKALSGGLYNFALRQEKEAGRDLTELKAKEKRDVINSYVPAYRAKLIERMGDSADAQSQRRNFQRLNNGLRDEIFTPDEVDGYIEAFMRAYSPEERDAYEFEQEQLDAATSVEEQELVGTTDVDPDQLATDDQALAWADGLELEYDSTDDLVDLLVEFKNSDMRDFELKQEEFDREVGAEDPNIKDRSPGGVTTEQINAEFDSRGKDAPAVETNLRQGSDRTAPRKAATPPQPAAQGETDNARMIRERREAQQTPEVPASVAEPTEDGDGTLRKATARVADRETISINMSDGSTEVRPIAGEFTLFGETFAVHRAVTGAGWAVSHTDTGLLVGTGAKSISAAAERAVKYLQDRPDAKAKFKAAIARSPRQTPEEVAQSEEQDRIDALAAQAEQDAANEAPGQAAIDAENETIADAIREGGGPNADALAAAEATPGEPTTVNIGGTPYQVIVEETPNEKGHIAWNKRDGTHMVRGLTKERILKYLQEPEIKSAVQKRQAKVREEVSQRFEEQYGNSFLGFIEGLPEKQLKQLVILHESRHTQQRERYGDEFVKTYRERPVDFEFDANRFALRELGLIDAAAEPVDTTAPGTFGAGDPGASTNPEYAVKPDELVETAPPADNVVDEYFSGQPPKGPDDPPSPPPPPPPDNDAQAAFRNTVKRMMSDRVRVEFGATDLPSDIAAVFVERPSVEQIREKLRTEKRALKDGNDLRSTEDIQASIDSLMEQEDLWLTDKAVRGTIRVAQGMEAQAGLAEHESFHAAFKLFFGVDNAADRKVVATAFTRGVLSNRLMKYFDGNDAVLAVIDPTSPDFNAEEAAAYGFQIFLHEPGALQMGEKVEGIFNKFLAYLRNLVGYKTYEERAKVVFNDLASGRRSERGTSVLRNSSSMEESMLDRSRGFVREVGTGFMHMYDTVLSSTYDRMESHGNPAMAQIARLGYNETGQRGNGMIQLQRLATTKYGNELKNAVHALSAEELGQLNQAMMLGQKLDGKLGEAQKGIRAMLTESFEYQKEAGITDLGFKDDYYPMVWNPEKVAADRQGFINMLSQPKYEEKMNDLMQTPSELADNISSYQERGGEFQGVFDNDGEPSADSSKRRNLDFIDKEDRMAYMEDDLVTTLAHYLNQSVRHAEYVRAYGQNGAKLTELLGEVTGTYGGSQQDVKLAKDYIDGLMGNKEIGMSRELKDLYGAMTVYQNVRLLPLSVFSSMVDPLGIAVRTGNMTAAFDAFAYSIRNMFTDFRNQKDWNPDWVEKYADDIGTIDMSGTVKSIDKIYTGNITLRGKTREVNDAFFKYNLLNGWVKNNHIMATKYAELFLRRSAEGMFGDAKTEQDLEEVGLSREDIIYDEQLGRIKTFSYEFLGYETSQQMNEQATADEIKDAKAQADKIQQAIHKIVRQSLIQPSSAEMPGWMSNPYLAPIAHLKTFVFGFNQTILQRLLYEAQRGNYSPLYYAAAYVPGMIAFDFIKGFAGNGGDEPEWKKDWGVSDYLGYGVERSGLMGTGQFLHDMNNDVTRGGGGWETLAGPSIEQAADLMGAMNGKTSEPTKTWMINAMPANALYDQWLMR